MAEGQAGVVPPFRRDELAQELRERLHREAQQPQARALAAVRLARADQQQQREHERDQLQDDEEGLFRAIHPFSLAFAPGGAPAFLGRA